jgi:hypothetical protein
MVDFVRDGDGRPTLADLEGDLHARRLNGAGLRVGGDHEAGRKIVVIDIDAFDHHLDRRQLGRGDVVGDAGLQRNRVTLRTLGQRQHDDAVAQDLLRRRRLLADDRTLGDLGVEDVRTEFDFEAMGFAVSDRLCLGLADQFWRRGVAAEAEPPAG